MEIVKNSWDQLPGETTKAYIVFRHYLMSGLKRTHVKTSEATDTPLSSINAWATQFEWMRRVADFENAQTNAFVSETLNLVKNNQSQIQEDELNDYNKLLDNWRQQFEVYTHQHLVENTDKDGVITYELVPPSLKDLKILIEARKIIDDYGRRAVALPANYREEENSSKSQLPPSGGFPLVIPGTGIAINRDDVNEDTTESAL